ncbi:MAG: DUF512 domain-containing protein [Ruminococcaceae bacterium]|nr:DUF512 domain-containing protein [Oscillospiraceae bacterium]
MSAEIIDVQKKSPCSKKRIKKGWVLQKINFHDINDILDYNFYASECEVLLELQKPNGKTVCKKIKKEENEDLGLLFNTYLMDKQKTCKNKCIFCFIDQLPEGMRESLYFKDDDSRMSFLFGNYITLTNLTDRDVERMIEMHINPVNISVHTMNPELRVKMMKNPHAGEVLKYIDVLANHGTHLNTQLVLCPGINDGEELKFSIEKLAKLYPSVQSIAAVPVGITKFRENLPDLQQYTPETAREVVDVIEGYQKEFLEKFGTRLVYASDEFYLKAGLTLPENDEYEDYPQIENGVGMWTDLEYTFSQALEETGPITTKTKKIIATGAAAYPLMEKLSRRFNEKTGADISVVKIENNFFGNSITVSGLITGKDLTEQLKDKYDFDELLISSTMLRSEGDMFLDSMTVEEAEKILDCRIVPVNSDGYELVEKMKGE